VQNEWTDLNDLRIVWQVFAQWVAFRRSQWLHPRWN